MGRQRVGADATGTRGCAVKALASKGPGIVDCTGSGDDVALVAVSVGREAAVSGILGPGEPGDEAEEIPIGDQPDRASLPIDHDEAAWSAGCLIERLNEAREGLAHEFIPVHPWRVERRRLPGGKVRSGLERMRRGAGALRGVG